MNVQHLGSTALHWREDGDPMGVAVVFANSLGTDLRLWDKIVPLLCPGLRLIRFDKRGHGLSSCPPAPYAMDDLVDDTEALLGALKVDTCVFVGLSIGGMIGQSLAARRKDLVRALVLSNTAARMGTPEMWETRIKSIETGGIKAISDAVLERWFAPAFRKTEEFAAWRAMLERTPVDGYVGCCHAIATTDLTATTRTLTLPTLGIAGAEDGASPPELVAATTNLMKNARLHEIEGAGHLPCVEKPEEFAAVLNSFLKETCDV